MLWSRTRHVLWCPSHFDVPGAPSVCAFLLLVASLSNKHNTHPNTPTQINIHPHSGRKHEYSNVAVFFFSFPVSSTNFWALLKKCAVIVNCLLDNISKCDSIYWLLSTWQILSSTLTCCQTLVRNSCVMQWKRIWTLENKCWRDVCAFSTLFYDVLINLPAAVCHCCTKNLILGYLYGIL